jgi:hypothetical protein
MVETNFTKIPNILLDNMNELGISNNKYLLILFYLLRHKKGYHLSNRQIENALSMHHKTVKNAIHFLKVNEFLDYKETTQGKIYNFHKLLKKINDVKSAEGDKNADAHTAEEDKNTDAHTAEGGDKSAEDVRPYSRGCAALLPTNNTNYNINYKTTKFSFEKIREGVIKNIHTFFNNDIDEVCKEIINNVDPSFYEFKNYIPTDNEISTFLENNKKETLDNFNNYLYNGLVSESFIYNGKLIKPRLALLNNNKIRLNELLNIYYLNKEQFILNKNEKSPFDKSSNFQEFLKQQTQELVEDEYVDLPEEITTYLHVVHEYDPPKNEELTDFHLKPIENSKYYNEDDEVEATDEDIDDILSEYTSSEKDKEEELSEEKMNEFLAEI